MKEERRMKDIIEISKEAVKFLARISRGTTPMYTELLGDENSGTVAANAPEYTKVIELNNQIGYDIQVEGIQLRYRTGLDDALIQININDKTNIIVGNTQFCQVGNRQDAAVGIDALPLKFILQKTNTLKVLVKSKSQAVNPGDISIILFGREAKGK